MKFRWRKEECKSRHYLKVRLDVTWKRKLGKVICILGGRQLSTLPYIMKSISVIVITATKSDPISRSLRVPKKPKNKATKLFVQIVAVLL